MKLDGTECRFPWFSASVCVLQFIPSLPFFFQSHDCLRNGPPDLGEAIVVTTPESKNLKASFVKEHVHKLYQVRGNSAILTHLQVTDPCLSLVRRLFEPQSAAWNQKKKSFVSDRLQMSFHIYQFVKWNIHSPLKNYSNILNFLKCYRITCNVFYRDFMIYRMNVEHVVKILHSFIFSFYLKNGFSIY